MSDSNSNYTTSKPIQVNSATGSNPLLTSNPGSNSSSTPGTPSKKSNRCAGDGCNERAVKIVGECKYCSLKYCGRHRLPEAHFCSNLGNCRQDSLEKLQNKLLKEKTVSERVQVI